MLISSTDVTVPVTVQARTTIEAAEAFAVVVPIDLSRVLTAWGPFPGVREVRNQTGPWDGAGRSREPVLTDGTTVSELLTEYTPGHSFAYEITGFTNALGRLVHGVRGEWTFTPDGPGTLIRWTYEFLPRPRARAVVGAALAPAWRRYQERALARTVAFLET